MQAHSLLSDVSDTEIITCNESNIIITSIIIIIIIIIIIRLDNYLSISTMLFALQ